MAENNTLLEKLDGLVSRFDEIGTLITDPNVIADQKRYVKLTKEYKDLSEIMKARKEYMQCLNGLSEARLMMNENDPELREMAREEIATCEARIPELEEEIKLLLVPADPEDDKNAIVEIRGGTGGDEAAIFAGDLYRMYTRYAESRGWKIQVMEASPSEAGGFSQIVFSIKGKEGAYGYLKWESGVHRVQRVPKTESQGRIQTSTATVYCYPQVEKTDFEIDMNDLEIETHRASGAGGQHINKTDSAVRIVHKPTGITVNCQEGRSQIENRETALMIIRARVYEFEREKEEAAAGEARRSKIGTGDRSEKIRTYNYPQNRVTDHRIGLSVNQLDRIMEGKLDIVIDGLRAEDEKKKLEESSL